jgi:hypothetical protein
VTPVPPAFAGPPTVPQAPVAQAPVAQAPVAQTTAPQAPALAAEASPATVVDLTDAATAPEGDETARDGEDPAPTRTGPVLFDQHQLLEP